MEDFTVIYILFMFGIQKAHQTPPFGHRFTQPTTDGRWLYSIHLVMVEATREQKAGKSGQIAYGVQRFHLAFGKDPRHVTPGKSATRQPRPNNSHHRSTEALAWPAQQKTVFIFIHAKFGTMQQQYVNPQFEM